MDSFFSNNIYDVKSSKFQCIKSTQAQLFDGLKLGFWQETIHYHLILYTQLHTLPGGIAVKEKLKVCLYISEVFSWHSKLFADSL